MWKKGTNKEHEFGGRKHALRRREIRPQLHQLICPRLALYVSLLNMITAHIVIRPVNEKGIDEVWIKFSNETLHCLLLLPITPANLTLQTGKRLEKEILRLASHRLS